MMTESAVRIVLFIGVGSLIAFASWWVVKHPNRSKKHPGRTRLPIFFPILGWLFVVVGAIVSLAALTIPAAGLAMQIAGVAIFAGGLGFLLMYRNFYVAPEASSVHFRTLMGREKVIVYEDIREVEHYQQGHRPFVMIKAADGTKLDLNPSMYDLSQMFDYLEARDARSDGAAS